MNVLEKILEEIENLNYYPEGMGCGIEDCGITDIYEACEYGWNEAIEAVIEVINNMDDGKDTNVPSNWIPVEERLPEEDSFEYIISCSDGITRTGVSYGYAKDEDKEPCFYKYDDEYWNCYRYNNVVAWQPLPEPYKGANYNG